MMPYELEVVSAAEAARITGVDVTTQRVYRHRGYVSPLPEGDKRAKLTLQDLAEIALAKEGARYGLLMDQWRPDRLLPAVHVVCVSALGAALRRAKKSGDDEAVKLYTAAMDQMIVADDRPEDRYLICAPENTRVADGASFWVRPDLNLDSPDGADQLIRHLMAGTFVIFDLHQIARRLAERFERPMVREYADA